MLSKRWKLTLRKIAKFHLNSAAPLLHLHTKESVENVERNMMDGHYNLQLDFLADIKKKLAPVIVK